jgi:hypothetical protein
MNKIWIIITAIAIFLIINLLYYKIMKGLVKESLGKKWLSVWGNKVYFWQSSIFVSTGFTVLIIFILKWSNVLTF